MLVGGIALITVGAIVLGWLAWQFWGTNWVSKGRQAEVVADLHGTERADFACLKRITIPFERREGGSQLMRSKRNKF